MDVARPQRLKYVVLAVFPLSPTLFPFQLVEMASSPSRIAALAAQIAEGTNRIDSYLQSNGIPGPSFDVDAPEDLNLTPELQDTKASVLAANEELQELLIGPRMLMFSHHVSYIHLAITTSSAGEYDG